MKAGLSMAIPHYAYDRETLSKSKMGTGHNQIKCCWHKQIKHSSSEKLFLSVFVASAVPGFCA